MRASGMVLGVAAYSWRRRLAAFDLNRVGLPAALALLLVNIAAVAYVAGWFRSTTLGVAAGVAGLTPLFGCLFSISTTRLTLDHVQRNGPRRSVCARGCGVLARGPASRPRSSLVRCGGCRPDRFSCRDKQGISCRPLARLHGRPHRGRLGDRGARRLATCLAVAASVPRSSGRPACGCCPSGQDASKNDRRAAMDPATASAPCLACFCSPWPWGQPSVFRPGDGHSH